MACACISVLIPLDLYVRSEGYVVSDYTVDAAEKGITDWSFSRCKITALFIVCSILSSFD